MMIFWFRRERCRVSRVRHAFAWALLFVLSQAARSSAQELTAPAGGLLYQQDKPQDIQRSAGEVEQKGQATDTSVRWGKVVRQTLSMQAVQHSFFMTQPKARRALGSGPWFHDWFQSASSPFVEPHWSDGGSFLVNYIAHPMAGSSYAYIFRQNDPQAMRLEFGQPGYFSHLAKESGIAALSSLQWELGPMSEASIENVGMPPDRYKMAWVDMVITPSLGVAWRAGEDAIDRYVIARLERKIDSSAGKAAIRILLNPTRSMANVMAGQKPWKRPARP